MEREEIQLNEMEMSNQAIVLKGSPEYFSLKAIEQGDEEPNLAEKPLYLSINLDTPCNLKCEKCALAGERIYGEKLNLDEQLETIDKISRMGAKELVIFGNGEPLIQPSFDNMVKPVLETANKEGMGTILFTNLNELTKEQAEFLKKNNVTIFISLDSLNPEIYRSITGGGNLNNVLKNILLLKSVYAKESSIVQGKKIGEIGVNFTLTRKNEKDLESVKKFAHNNKMQFIANTLMQKGRAKDKEVWEDLTGGEENYKKQLNIAKNESDTGGHSSLTEGACGYGHGGISVDIDGQLLVCGYAGETGSYHPNIREMSEGDLKNYYHKKQKCWKETISGTCFTRTKEEEREAHKNLFIK